jgi:hypothetical protein
MEKSVKIFLLIILNGSLGFCIYETVNAQSFTIGQKYQGGIIFYIDSTGQHGLIAAPFDVRKSAPLASSMTWRIPGAYGSEVGAGHLNTLDMLQVKMFQAETAPYLCSIFNLDGYTDWFLPSMDELDLLYLHKNEIGDFSSKFYWSSTLAGGRYAWAQHFFDGTVRLFYFTAGFGVRAIRTF